MAKGCKHLRNKTLVSSYIFIPLVSYNVAILMRRRWRWIGHVNRQETSITKTALHWTPEGKRREGRPSEDHMAADDREGNEADGEDLEQHSSHGKGSRCCRPYTPSGVMGMSECLCELQ